MVQPAYTSLRTASRPVSPSDERLASSLTSASTFPTKLSKRPRNGPSSPTITTQESSPQAEIQGPSSLTAMAVTVASSLAVLGRQHRPTSPTQRPCGGYLRTSKQMDFRMRISTRPWSRLHDIAQLYEKSGRVAGRIQIHITTRRLELGDQNRNKRY